MQLTQNINKRSLLLDMFSSIYQREGITNYNAIQTVDPPIIKNILKLNQQIPKFHFTIKFEEWGSGPVLHIYVYCVFSKLSPKPVKRLNT